jgi:hypothetical protein
MAELGSLEASFLKALKSHLESEADEPFSFKPQATV